MRSGPPSVTASGSRTDDELMAAHRAGDRHAFPALVDRHRESLRALARRTLHDPEDAADAVQEALVAAYRWAGSHRGDAAVRTWLHRILVNACIDRIRYDSRRATVPLARGDADARRRDLAGDVATRLVLADALRELPVEQRLAVVLVDAQGWSVGEAAELLEVPVGTVKSRCARGRARLAELLGPLGEAP